MDITRIPSEQFSGNFQNDFSSLLRRCGRAEPVAQSGEGSRFPLGPFSFRNVSSHPHEPDHLALAVFDRRSSKQDRKFGAILAAIEKLAAPTTGQSLLEN